MTANKQESTATATATMGPTNNNAVDITTASSRNVRFALRKKRAFAARTMINDNEEVSPVNLSSYNSDFLSGLFADVAKANVLKEFEIEPSSSSSSKTTSSTTPSSMFDVERGPSSSFSPSHLISDPSNSPRPLKKSRLNLRSSLYQSRASCMNLLDIQQQQQQEPLSPKGINEIEMLEKQERSISSNKNKKQDSLAFQLDCLETQELTTTTGALSISEIVSVSPSNKKSKKVVKDVAILAFPNLPSAISDSSCESSNTTHTGATTTATGLTRESGVPHGPSSEIAASSRGSSKESFGWFVDLDEQEETKSSSGEDFVHSSSLTVTTNNKNASTEDLAFQAPTAPKRSTNHDEEMEQAYAADTIDSVLGDLF
jgi:hypothetical protein